MTPDDLRRELTKIQQALGWAEHHFARQGEANAALHCNETVLYPPIAVAVINARRALDGILADGDTASPRPS